MRVRPEAALWAAALSTMGAGCAALLGVDGNYDDQADDAGTERDEPIAPGLSADDDVMPTPPDIPNTGNPTNGSGGEDGTAGEANVQPEPEGQAGRSPSGGAGTGSQGGGSQGGGSQGGGSQGGGSQGGGSQGGGSQGGNSATGGSTSEPGGSGPGGEASGGASAMGGSAGSMAGEAGTGGGTNEDIGVRLRGVQSGGAVVETGSLSSSVSIDAVDPGRSLLVFGTLFNSTSSSFTELTGRLADATTLVFERGASSNSAPDVPVHYYVAEFERGVSVQRGSQVLEQSLQQVALGTPVDLENSVPLITLRNAGGDYKADDFVRAELSGASQLSLSTYNAMASGAVEWQVVSFDEDSAQVQSATVTLPESQVSIVAPLAETVDPTRAWLVLSYELGAASQAANQLLVRGSLSSESEVVFQRSGAGPSVEITYYLVEFAGATRVQSGTRTLSASESSVAVSISVVDPQRSIAVANGPYARSGSTSLSDSADVGSTTFLLTLDQGTELTLSRGASESDAPVDWSVLTFP